MEKAKLRINRGIEIEVNDEGDTICVNVESAECLDKFNALMDKFNAFTATAGSEQFKEMNTDEKLALIRNKTTEILNGIDDIFGIGASRKVFGDITPSMYLIAQFFEQILPIFQKYAEERHNAITTKYNASRKFGAPVGR